MSTTYTPIDCNHYDYLEEAATLKTKNVILFKGSMGMQIQNGQIADLYSRDKVEYLRLGNGTEIRLDTIQMFNDIDFSTKSNCIRQ